MFKILTRRLMLVSIVLVFSAPIASASDGYIFAWPFIQPEKMQPRGGTTQGAEVQLDNAENAEFAKIQAPGISDFERDRHAILAMSGPYRVSFDFLEVVGYGSDFEPAQPYRSWGTEFVYVLEDNKDFISLQHVLVMSFMDKDGKEVGPFVTKHWRQDWQYEPRATHVFKGNNTWQRKQVPSKKRRGYWLQRVWQVDDSPRYAGWGQWHHEAQYSTWNSNLTWRPLPRREYSVRKDYDVLVGRNQHTVVADGWVQEEHNDKVVLGSNGEIERRLSREYGVARYQRIKEFDFGPGDRYLESTAEFWKGVRDYWNEVMDNKETFHLKAPVDQAGLFIPLFERAQAIADGAAFNNNEDKTFIQKTIDGLLSDQPTGNSGY